MLRHLDRYRVTEVRKDPIVNTFGVKQLSLLVLFDPEDECATILRNSDNYLP
jgi:hypothetical protein